MIKEIIKEINNIPQNGGRLSNGLKIGSNNASKISNTPL